MSPIFRIGGFGFKLDVLFIFFATLDLFIFSRFFLSSKISLSIIIPGVLLFFSMLISDNIGLYVLNSWVPYFPREYIQIFTRFVCFLFFLKLSYDKLFKFRTLTYVLIFSLIVGVLQIGDLLNLNSFFAQLYAPTDNQLNTFSNAHISLRIFGIAGNPISWGGFSLFSFFYFSLIEKGFLKRFGLTISLINILFAVSKSAIISLLFVSFLIPVLYYFYYGYGLIKVIKSYWKLIFVLFAAISLLFNIFYEKFDFLITRFNAFLNLEKGQSTRFDQVFDAFELMQSYLFSFLIGFGKPAISKVIPYIEVEPVYLLASYGFFGVLLHYLPLIFLIYFSYKLRKNQPKMALFVPVSIFSYLIFSLGFYFFRELQIGNLFWIVNGIIFGALLSLNKKSLA